MPLEKLRNASLVFASPNASFRSLKEEGVDNPSLTRSLIEGYGIAFADSTFSLNLESITTI